VYQDPCKALQCLATSQVMRTRQARHCNANDRLRNTSRVTYFRDIGPQSVPLPSGEHLSFVRPSLAAGIAGLTASASSVPTRVPQRGCFAAAPLPGGQPAHGPARHAA
jgi:hypothetical protein